MVVSAAQSFLTCGVGLTWPEISSIQHENTRFPRQANAFSSVADYPLMIAGFSNDDGHPSQLPPIAFQFLELSPLLLLLQLSVTEQITENITQPFVTRFILFGISGAFGLQVIFFLLFLLMYLMSLSGNLFLIIVVRLNPRLQNPMYFFLSNLSLIDIGVCTTVVPKILQNTFSKDRSISFMGCAAQLYFHLSLGATECLIMAVMAYDRYIAICKPLHYTTIMNPKHCLCLAAACWITSFVDSMIHAVFTFLLHFCKSNYLNHFFCEMPPLFRLSCTDTWISELLIYTCGFICTVVSLSFICFSYFQIILTIVKIRCAKGRHKAFSTCASHLTGVNIYFGTLIFMYLRPRSMNSPARDRVVSIFYTTVIPMLNPLIYSVRNKDIKDTLQRTKNTTQKRIIMKRPTSGFLK
ncbi:olfactory receptor 5I1-like [Gastrophryne carolinensis]